MLRRPEGIGSQSSAIDLTWTGSLGLPSSGAVDGSSPPAAILSSVARPGLVDGAEDGVVRRQLRVLVHEEELAAVGARAGVGHRQRAARIDHRLPGARGRPAGTGRSGTRWRTGSPGRRCRRPWVAALQHRQARGRGQPVAGGVVEVALLGQAGEAVDRAGRLGVVQLQADVALIGAHADADLGRIGRHLARAWRIGLLGWPSGDAGYWQFSPKAGGRCERRQRLAVLGGAGGASRAGDVRWCSTTPCRWRRSPC